MSHTIRILYPLKIGFFFFFFFNNHSGKNKQIGKNRNKNAINLTKKIIKKELKIQTRTKQIIACSLIVVVKERRR